MLEQTIILKKKLISKLSNFSTDKFKLTLEMVFSARYSIITTVTKQRCSSFDIIGITLSKNWLQTTNVSNIYC